MTDIFRRLVVFLGTLAGGTLGAAGLAKMGVHGTAWNILTVACFYVCYSFMKKSFPPMAPAKPSNTPEASEMTHCPVCNAYLKKTNLDSHTKRLHPEQAAEPEIKTSTSAPSESVSS